MTDPTPCLFITRRKAVSLCPAAVDRLTGGQGRATVVGPIRDRDEMGFQVRVYGPGLPANGRPVTNGEAVRLH